MIPVVSATRGPAEPKPPNACRLSSHAAAELPTSPPLIVPLLMVLTFATFAGVLWCGFVNYDDPSYITENSHVKAGLTPDTIRWALTSRIQDLYDPVTVLSFAAEVQIFGLNPAGFHLDNLIVHAANVFLLYKLFLRMTSAPWRSAMVAALWAVHPLRVESVAWVMERKDVLMAFFGLAALHVYVSNVQRPRRWMPLAIAVLLVLSLLSKPALVVFPVLLLLIDIWPLGRTKFWKREATDEVLTWRWLIFEKVLVIAVCAITAVMYLGGAPGITRGTNIGEPTNLLGRVENAVVSYLWYPVKMIDIRNLAAFYPIPQHWPAWRVAACACVLGIGSIATFTQGRTRPWLTVGWFWFIVTLLPVIGIVSPINHSAPADRFTYISSIGLLIGTAWAVPASWAANRTRQCVVGMVVAAILIPMAIVTAANVRYWQDSASLWGHALDAAHDNWMAECNYAIALDQEGQPAEAMPHYLESVRLNPESAQSHFNYGAALENQGDIAGATAEYCKAAKLAPQYSKATLAAGTLLLKANNYSAAADLFNAASKYDSQFVPFGHFSHGSNLLQRGQAAKAIFEFDAALRAQPDFLMARIGLGAALLKTGHAAEAAEQFETAERLKPDDPAIRKNLESALHAAAELSSTSSGHESTTRPAASKN